ASYALERALDDAQARDRFFAAAFALLSPEQSEALVPAAARGRMRIDLFSSGLSWQAGPTEFSDKEFLGRSVSTVTAQGLALGESRDRAIHDAVVEWADALPREVFDVPGDALSRKGFLPIALVEDMARRELAMLRRIVDLARLDEAGAASVRRRD